MPNIIILVLVALIVGFVTAGLKIRFDRFFSIILLLTLAKLSIFNAINISLWIIFFGSLWFLFENRDKLKKLPQENKKKFLTIIPLLTFVGVVIGTYLFARISPHSLLIVLGILALLYGLRLIFIHFQEHEHHHKNERPLILKMCGLLGPIVSGFFVGLISTGIKPLKISFAVKVGKMNMAQTYLGNAITATYASFFAIILHSFYSVGRLISIADVWIGIGLWVAIHLVYQATNLVFPSRWQKSFQVVIGFVLILVSIKFLR